jgi:hypothetical protein
VHTGNVKYEERDGKLLKAYLLDWGNAEPAPEKGPDGKFTPAQEEEIVRIISMFAIH